jgi:hypothetical protein
MPGVHFFKFIFGEVSHGFGNLVFRAPGSYVCVGALLFVQLQQEVIPPVRLKAPRLHEKALNKKLRAFFYVAIFDFNLLHLKPEPNSAFSNELMFS